MRHDTAGDPITGVKWSRRTTRNIAAELTALGIAVSKRKCADSTWFRTTCLAAGTIPYVPLRM
jgi:hypothetical protein